MRPRGACNHYTSRLSDHHLDEVLEGNLPALEEYPAWCSSCSSLDFVPQPLPYKSWLTPANPVAAAAASSGKAPGGVGSPSHLGRDGTVARCAQATPAIPEPRCVWTCMCFPTLTQVIVPDAHPGGLVCVCVCVRANAAHCCLACHAVHTKTWGSSIQWHVLPSHLTPHGLPQVALCLVMLGNFEKWEKGHSQFPGQLCYF